MITNSKSHYSKNIVAGGKFTENALFFMVNKSVLGR